MSRFAKAIQRRREYSRSRRAMNSAIGHAATPTLRDELILTAQRTDGMR
jgi:hypothetical protein